MPYWPSGPAWFLWALLVLDAVSATLTWARLGWGDALGRWVGKLTRPAAFFWVLVAVSACAYLPLAVALGPGYWASFGPFSLQASRAGLYAAYFFAGVGLGASGVAREFLAPAALLARRWPVWVLAALGAFLVTVVVFLGTLSRGAAAGQGAWALVDVCFVLSCATASFACLALFARYVRAGPVGDSLAANAYGMYLTHYPCVSWLQYFLLGAAFSGAVKGTLVFLGAAALSWGATALLRRIPAVGRLISSVPPSSSNSMTSAAK